MIVDQTLLAVLRINTDTLVVVIEPVDASVNIALTINRQGQENIYHEYKPAPEIVKFVVEYIWTAHEKLHIRSSAAQVLSGKIGSLLNCPTESLNTPGDSVLSVNWK